MLETRSEVGLEAQRRDKRSHGTALLCCQIERAGKDGRRVKGVIKRGTGDR